MAQREQKRPVIQHHRALGLMQPVQMLFIGVRRAVRRDQPVSDPIDLALPFGQGVASAQHVPGIQRKQFRRAFWDQARRHAPARSGDHPNTVLTAPKQLPTADRPR